MNTRGGGAGSSSAESFKTASRVKKLELKLEAEINAKELTTRRLQEIEKKLPGTGALSKYDLLWISSTATIEETQRQFKHLSLLIHADKGGQAERFQLLNQRRCILMDDGARNIYETHGWKFAVEFLN